MTIYVQLINGHIPNEQPQASVPECGAWVEFRGLVRGQEDGAAIETLEYEAYSPMAEAQMRRIIEDIASRHPCGCVRVIHRIGIVPVGQSAIYVGVGAKHRGEAFTMLSEFMERLKQDVPIWKVRAVQSAAQTPTHAASSSHLPGVHSAEEVIQLVRENCGRLEIEPVPLASALGRVLGQAVHAREPQPAFDRSSVDGYAVRLDDPGPRFKVVDEIRAGQWKPRVLGMGEAVRISTGAAVPSPGLQVIMREEARYDGATVMFEPRDSNPNIRVCGEDAAAGQQVVASGTILEPGTLALLATVGWAEPLVARLPRVLHLATGDEIAGVEQTLAPGQIHDSNSIMVRAFLGQWGITPEQERVGEAEEAIWRGMENRIQQLDLLLISGGASVGEHDSTRRLLERAGFVIRVHKTNARPGKPLIVAQRGQTLAFGLPGNPLAHFVCVNLYVRAALEAWAGQTTTSVFRTAVLQGDFQPGENNRETFWPAFWQLGAGRIEVTPLRWSSSGDLTALASANALLRIPERCRALSAGTEVHFLPATRRLN